MKRLLSILLLCAVLPAMAQGRPGGGMDGSGGPAMPPGPPMMSPEQREQWHQMPHEERRQQREQWRQMSPEERHQLRRDIRDAGQTLYPRGRHPQRRD